LLSQGFFVSFLLVIYALNNNETSDWIVCLVFDMCQCWTLTCVITFSVWIRIFKYYM
jgi:hypothetical protein